MRCRFFSGQLDRPKSHRPCRCCRAQPGASVGVDAVTQGVPLSAAHSGLVGGHGIPYVTGDPELDRDALRDLSTMRSTRRARLRAFCARLSWSSGAARSARAGVTLYRVVSAKSQPGGRTGVVVRRAAADRHPSQATARSGVQALITTACRRPTTWWAGHCSSRSRTGAPVDNGCQAFAHGE
jgi:diaminopimelate decarboxylase